MAKKHEARQEQLDRMRSAVEQKADEARASLRAKSTGHKKTADKWNQ